MPRAFSPRACTRGVAGAYAPAFVERSGVTLRSVPPGVVSPELMLRPSLSDGGDMGVVETPDVSPELMLRPSLSAVSLAGLHPEPQPVSPELMLRPSLSEAQAGRDEKEGGGVSPELMLRPSLSEDDHESIGLTPPRVAGAYAPAFVERRAVPMAWTVLPSVAGAYAPAFVERTGYRGESWMASRCRRSLCSGLR